MGRIILGKREIGEVKQTKTENVKQRLTFRHNVVVIKHDAKTTRQSLHEKPTVPTQ